MFVGRPTKWGNRFKVGDDILVDGVPKAKLTADMAVYLFRLWLNRDENLLRQVRAELRGHDLACFCPLDQQCHAAVLLQIANGATD